MILEFARRRIREVDDNEVSIVDTEISWRNVAVTISSFMKLVQTLQGFRSVSRVKV